MSQRTSLRAELHGAILRRIIYGELSPGKRIKEMQLADTLGASRTPLREALFSLERDGFVRSEVDRGFSVAPLSGREVREIYPMLWTLEGLAVQSGIPVVYRLIDKLTEVNSRIRGRVKPEQALKLDTQWHETLVSASPNVRLKQELATLRMAIRRYEYIYMRNDVLIEESARQHQKIIDCLSAKDADGAIRHLTENWRHGMHAILIQLGEL